MEDNKVKTLNFSDIVNDVNSFSPRKIIETSSIETKMINMRERFKNLQLVEDQEENTKNFDENRSEELSLQPPSATNRWSKLRKVVRADSQDKFSRNLSLLTPRNVTSSENITEKDHNHGEIELEDIQLMEFWEDAHIINFNSEEKLLGSTEPPVVETTAEGDFETEYIPVNVSVSRIPEQVVAEQKEKIQLSLYDEQSKIADNIKRKEVDVIWREHLARERLTTLEEEARTRIDSERDKLVELSRQRDVLLGKDFRKMREELEAGLRRQQGAVKENFGQMVTHEESIARRFQVFSKLLPQPVEVRIHLLRAVKTKLRKGAYVMMLTQYDSLGGRPLNWSQIGVNGIGSLRPGLTKVFKHYGRYFDRTLRVEDSCFALCPPRPLLKPSFVFILELFELASRHNPHDRIVGWSAVPMSYESMSLIEGKVKLPFLQGEHSPDIKHFREMENSMAHNLNNWLCNGYLEVRHMSLEELGVDEAILKSTDFDLDYFNKLLAASVGRRQTSAHHSSQQSMNGSPSTSGRAGGALWEDGDLLDRVVNHGLSLPVDKGVFRRKQSVVSKNATTATRVDLERAAVEDLEVGDRQPLLFESEDAPASGGVLGKVMTFFGPQSKALQFNGKRSLQQIHTSVLQRDESFVAHRNALIQQWKNNIRSKLLPSARGEGAILDDDASLDEVRERGYNLQDEVFLHRQQRGKLAGVEAVDSRAGRQWAAAGLEGTIVRRWQSDGPRFDSEAIASSKKVQAADGRLLSPNPSRVTGLVTILEQEEWHELRDSREMEDYSMSIASDPSRRKNLIPGATARTKIRYLSVELFGDLAPRLFGTVDFYITIFMFLFAFWIRLYVHFLAQYLYLESLGTPIFGFRMEVLQVSFKYMSESISTAGEVGVVAIGPVANICVFLFLVCSGALFYKLVKVLPDVVSKLLSAYGVATIFDPLFTLLVDVGYHNYDCTSVSAACRTNYVSRDCDCFNGDFIKLWYRMLRIEGSGITGLFIMLLLYIGSSVFSVLILYEYLVHLHRDGRILDIWRRVNAPAEEFFLPHDYEISSDELSSICGKATRWKGLLGAKRKLVTVEGTERDPQDRNFLGRFKRYIIYEVETNGRNSVYRQFLLDTSGVILEIFEDVKRANQQRHLFGEIHPVSFDEAPSVVVLQTSTTPCDESNMIQIHNDSDDEENELIISSPLLQLDKEVTKA